MEPAYTERKVLKILKPKILFPLFDMTRHADYLVYRLYILSLKAALFLAMLFLIDVTFEVYFFFDDVAEIPFRCSQVLFCLFAVLSLACYLSIRREMDMSSADIPLFMHEALLKDVSRSKWIKRIVFLLPLLILTLFYLYEFVHPVARNFGVDGNAQAVVIIWLFSAMITAVVPPIIVIYILKLEKIIRYFEDFKRQILSEASRRNK